MHWTKIGTTAGAAFILGILAGGAGVVAQQQGGSARGTEPPAASSNHEAKTERPADLDAKLLPQDQSQGQLATQIFRDELRAYGKEDPNGAKLDNLVRWSKAILDDSDRAQAARIIALEDHLARMRMLRETVNHLESSPSNRRLALQVAYYRQEAAQMLARAKAGRPEPASEPEPDSSRQAGKESEPDHASQAILKTLEEPIAMKFDKDTPLEDVLKYIKSATADQNGKGIPIYLDPVGLQVAEKTPASPIVLNLEGVPLKTTLTLMLAQLGMCYEVKAGVLIVTSPDVEPGVAPLEILENKARRGELTGDEEVELTRMLRTLNEVQRLKWEGLKSFRQEGLKQGLDPSKPQGGAGGGFR